MAADGQEGLFLLSNHAFDLIILDVMLPTINGWDLIEQIRKRNLQLPVLFLTAKGSVDDKVKGLELGADDYLVKPFAFSELLARVRTLIRREQPQTESILSIANLEIDPLKHKVLRAGIQIQLTAKEYALLMLLVRKSGEVLSRTYIIEQVWDINFDCDTNVVDVAIKRLRDKIDKNHACKLIHAVRGVGYVLKQD